MLLLSLCFVVPKPSSKAIAASEKVNITSYDCTYNSETGKYDCEVEGINSTDNYMRSLRLVAVDDFKIYLPLEDDNIFVNLSPQFRGGIIAQKETFVKPPL